MAARNLASHRLIAGRVIQTAIAGMEEATVMTQTRHASPAVLRRFGPMSGMFMNESAASSNV
jgi:hypothetical protein